MPPQPSTPDVAPSLTVVIVAKNEGRNITECVASASFANEVLVLDSGSSDNTAALAAKAGARVVRTDWPGYGPQVARGFKLATTDWVLSLDADVQAALDGLEDEGKTIAGSWEAEKTVETEEQLKQLLRDQLPFHFHGDPPPGYGEETVGSPEVLRYFANMGYGAFDYRPKLKDVDKPTLVIVGEHDRTTTPRASRVLHEGIQGSELVVIPDAGHMSFVEQTDHYLAAVRDFLARTP